MTIKKIFLSLLISLLYFETSNGNYFNGEGYLNGGDLTQMKNRFRRSADEMLLQHPLRFKSRYEDRKFLLKPPMHVRRTLPFQLVTQPKTSAFISNTEGRSFPIHFPSMDSSYQRARNLYQGGGISELTKDNTMDDFTMRLQEKEKNEEGLPPIPTSSAVTFKNNLTPSDLLSMLRGYSSEMNDENQQNRMRFGLF
uniref:Uncharacterized protein n=1 Tax=Lepeophtheirus salmonis TaxID=72036 RepID=A0A0K2TJM2_LEPSM